MEGVAEEEEVDDQLLWNLQILSEVDLKSGSACVLLTVAIKKWACLLVQLWDSSVISLFRRRRRQRER